MRLSFKQELIIGIASMFLFIPIIVLNASVYLNAQQVNVPSATPIKPDNTTILTAEAVSKHNKVADCFIAVNSKVYSVSAYLFKHPGGGRLITPYCGQDATQAFVTKDGRGSHSSKAYSFLQQLYIGDLNGKVTNQPSTQQINAIPEGGEDDD